MIEKSTVKALDLKALTQAMCYDFYVKVNTEFNSPKAIKESITWWQDDSENLNKLWWVLNYYSDQFDPARKLRAIIENHLNRLARKKLDDDET